MKLLKNALVGFQWEIVLFLCFVAAFYGSIGWFFWPTIKLWLAPTVKPWLEVAVPYLWKGTVILSMVIATPCFVGFFAGERG